MPYTEVQTIEAFGGQHTEYRYEPDFEEVVEPDLTRYITAIKNPDDKNRNRYLVDLFNCTTGKGQRVDLVIQESGFKAMATEIRNHFSSSWEVYSWLDCHEPF
jgi:hypothetical protein